MTEERKDNLKPYGEGWREMEDYLCMVGFGVIAIVLILIQISEPSDENKNDS